MTLERLISPDKFGRGGFIFNIAICNVTYRMPEEWYKKHCRTFIRELGDLSDNV